jgi:antitoxin MazE
MLNAVCSARVNSGVMLLALCCLDHKTACDYNVAMKTRIIKIGNSQGIRIPKLLLERSNLAQEVELEAEDNRIIIRSLNQPRQDWESEFRAMAERGDDELLDTDLLAQTQLG